MLGEWIRRPQGDISVVFVHGILSSGETCWLNKNGSYWPLLLREETQLQRVGIYVFTYETGIFSGSYRLSDIVDALKEHMRLDDVIQSGCLIFVCHSMGGIVVRKYIVERATELMETGKELGLFLVASPSLGVHYADWLSPLAQLFGHAQADVLRFVRSNDWLKDLDKEFLNLKEASKVTIQGKELVEDKFIVLKKFWIGQVVEPLSGARYFGEPYKVPGSDHFSIAKPSGKSAIQHRLLCQFVKDIQAERVSESLAGRKRRTAVMFESVERESLKQLEHFKREINEPLARIESHAKLIADNPAIERFLMDSGSEANKLKAHQVLLDHSDIGPYATTFVLNSAGVCIENSRHVLSIGKNYSFRPYFKDAMQSRIGRFPAIGITSGVLGHHVAYPIRKEDKVIGAACVEVDMQYIATQSNAFVYTETGGGDRPWIRALADQNGVIMLSSEESWVYRALAKIPDETLEVLRETRQYPGQELAEIECAESPDTSITATSNLPLQSLRWRDALGNAQQRIFAVREAPISGGWKVLIFWQLNIPLS